MDLVKCMSCEFVGLVDAGKEDCPVCNKTGGLSWLDENNKELDDLDNKILNCDCLDGFKLIKDESIDLIISDPPYGVNYVNNYTLDKHKKIENDNIDSYKWFIDECYRVLKPNSHIYLFTRFDVYPQHYNDLIEAGFKIKNVLVIEKGHIGGVGDLKGSYRNNSEWIIFAHKGRKEFEKTKLMKNSKPVGKKVARDGNLIQEYKTRFDSCWFGEQYPKSTYNASWQKKNDIKHPTIKNVDLLEWLIQISSKENDLVLDMFMGSGSTALACMSTNRKYVGFEIDDEYYNLIMKRVGGNYGI